MVSANGLATRWNVLEGMSFRAAVEPVVIAMWAGAVSDGVTVRFRSARSPTDWSRPRPSWRLDAPLSRNSCTSAGVAPSSEITMTLGAAPASATTARQAVKNSSRAIAAGRHCDRTVSARRLMLEPPSAPGVGIRPARTWGPGMAPGPSGGSARPGSAVARLDIETGGRSRRAGAIARAETRVDVLQADDDLVMNCCRARYDLRRATPAAATRIPPGPVAPSITRPRTQHAGAVRAS